MQHWKQHGEWRYNPKINKEETSNAFRYKATGSPPLTRAPASWCRQHTDPSPADRLNFGLQGKNMKKTSDLFQRHSSLDLLLLNVLSIKFSVCIHFLYPRLGHHQWSLFAGQRNKRWTVSKNAVQLTCTPAAWFEHWSNSDLQKNRAFCIYAMVLHGS